MQDNLRVQCENFPPQMSQEEKPEEARVIAAITRTLQVGAKKFNNLFFYGPRNAGKSCAIDPASEPGSHTPGLQENATFRCRGL